LSGGCLLSMQLWNGHCAEREDREHTDHRVAPA
jgi:hypothetical protein